MVSHNNCITPTDCAKYLENKTGVAYGELEEVMQTLTSNWTENLLSEKNEFRLLAGSLKQSWDIRGKIDLQRIQPAPIDSGEVCFQ